MTLGLKVLTGSSSGSGSTQGGGGGEGEVPSHMAHRINEAEVGPLEAELIKLTPSLPDQVPFPKPVCLCTADVF